MDFEKNRREVLLQLSKMRPSEKGQQNLFKNKPTQKVNFSSKHVTISQSNKKEIILFAQKSLLVRNLLQTLSTSYSVTQIDDPEKACNYCLDKDINTILLDMDEPTDWKMSHDVFTTIKTINTKVMFILFTKDINTVPVRTLAAQGAAVLCKPIRFEELYSAINR